MSSKKLSNYLKRIIPLVVLLCLGQVLQAQQITGQVVSDNGEKLPGVSVQIEGTTTGTVTDIDGKFSINVTAKGAVLVFTYVGFLTERRNVGTEPVINVTMVTDLKTLDEVVVVGYGTQKKRDITGAITSVSDKSIENRQPVDVFDALQGEAPGVMIISNSGAPGDGSTISIRGNSTFEGGVNPLYIVDGVPQSDISMINPSDIKSMEILKDAASSAIYGSRSANGVIIITTKSGEAGKPAVNVKYVQSYSQLSRKIPQANAYDRKIFENRTKVDLYSLGSDSLGISTNANNDYQDLITQTAKRGELNFSVSGGNEGLKYFTSLSYLDETGIVLNSYNKRLTGRVNIDYQATRKFKASSRISFGYQNTNSINEGKVIQQAMQRPPHFILYFPDGSYAFDIAGRKNPIAEAYYRKNEENNYEATVYEQLEYKFTDWLSLQSDLSGVFGLDRRNYLNSKKLSSTLADGTQIGDGGDETGWNRNLAAEAFLSFNKTFSADHTVTAMAGASAEDWYDENLEFSGSNYVTEDVSTVNSLQLLDKTETFTDASSHSMVGLFGRLSYSYKGKYLFNSNIRRDGSSRFANNRWGTFPSASLGWRFSDERFMDWSKSFLSDAKLRASWGVTGNERVGNYDALQTYVFGTNYYNGISGVRPNSSFGNPALRWEETTQTNFGTDLSFFNGKLSVNLDYYIKNTDGLLYGSKMPAEIGYSDIKVNLGSIENKGYEVNISGYPIQRKNFTWQTALNFSANKNKITKLAQSDYVQSSTHWVGVGQPMGQFYGYQAQGVYQYDASNAYTADFKQQLIPYFERDALGNVILTEAGNPIVKGYTYQDGTDYNYDPTNNPVYQRKVGTTLFKGGDMIWEDLNYDGQIDDKDRKVLGNGIPSWFGGWSNTFTYKNLSLTFIFYASWGNQVYNQAKWNLTQYATSNVTPQPYEIYNAWRFQGQITDVPIASKQTVNNTARQVSSVFLENGSFIRLRNLRLTYTLKNNFVQKLHMKGLSAFLYGNNLATWTNYTGFDPEVGGGTLTPSVDNGRYPRKKEYGLGINVNF